MSRGCKESRAYHHISFCPWCGVAAIRKDDYRQQKDTGKARGTEWICDCCGFGFMLGPSKRVATANLLHAEHRQLRNGVTFKTSCVGEDIAREFTRAHPAPDPS